MDRLEQASRKFYDYPTYHQSNTHRQSDPNVLKGYVRENIIGHRKTFQGPFGRRRILYCDYVASGRSLKFIEDFITDEVLPDYGNTHTTTRLWPQKIKVSCFIFQITMRVFLV